MTHKFVVFNPEGKDVATVYVDHTDSSVCVVEVWNYGPDGNGFQRKVVSGHGYDKVAAALAGMTIDGHVMHDYCAPGLPSTECALTQHVYMPGLRYLEAIGYRVTQVV